MSYNNYTCNRYTFEQFLELQDPHTTFIPIIVNPLHHTNSTSITDWALRRSNTTIHLVEKYTSQYWAIVTAAVGGVGVEGFLEQNNDMLLQDKINELSLVRHNNLYNSLTIH
ncbi:hypothetical protein EON65_14450 [archaeon]|nr:MAG: hypothetical protein EON65_14450 [archaeon]